MEKTRLARREKGMHLWLYLSQHAAYVYNKTRKEITSVSLVWFIVDTYRSDIHSSVC